MTSNQEVAPRMNLGDLLELETSLLRTLCLTVNSEGSELKYQILDNLSEGDFYFPVTRMIYATIAEMHKSGDVVTSAGLDQELSRRAVDVPDDFYLEDLFSGELPSNETMAEWLRALGGEAPAEEAAMDEESDDEEPPLVKLEKTRPTVKVPPEVTEPSSYGQPSAGPEAASSDDDPDIPAEPPPPRDEESPKKPEELAAPAPAAAAEPVAGEKKDAATVSKDRPTPRAESSTPTPKAAPPVQKKVAAKPAAAPSSPTASVLAPESGEWLRYIADLSKKQGKRLKTGFAGFDAEAGGLGTGLLLLAGDDQDCVLDFLKQLVDQIAIECRVPCLYLSFERSKTALRLQTLSRLTKAPAEDIENGKYEKDSVEWQEIVRAGEHAVEWLQRIYVVEAEPGITATNIRQLREGLLGSGAGPTCLVAVDNLEKLASKSDLLQSVAELKELAESLGIVVIGGASVVDEMQCRSADMAATLSSKGSEAVVSLQTKSDGPKAELRFLYSPETHRFDERSKD